MPLRPLKARNFRGSLLLFRRFSRRFFISSMENWASFGSRRFTVRSNFAESSSLRITLSEDSSGIFIYSPTSTSSLFAIFGTIKYPFYSPKNREKIGYGLDCRFSHSQKPFEFCFPLRFERFFNYKSSTLTFRFGCSKGFGHWTGGLVG